MADRPDLPLFRWGETSAARSAALARLRQRRIVGASLWTSLALVATLWTRPLPRLVWNASASTPRGLYVVTPGRDVRRGDIVLVWFPRTARHLADQRRYLPWAVPAVKPVAAIQGDRVCAAGATISINGAAVARRLARDAIGRPLPWWRGCATLGSDTVFLLSAARPDSFDGRYFGPIPRSHIIGKARLIWAR